MGFKISRFKIQDVQDSNIYFHHIVNRCNVIAMKGKQSCSKANRWMSPNKCIVYSNICLDFMFIKMGGGEGRVLFVFQSKRKK